MQADWRDFALCAGHDASLWFPDYTRPDSYKAARAICEACPVRLPCLAETMAAEKRADQHERFGMFGGLTPAERRTLQQQLRATG